MKAAKDAAGKAATPEAEADAAAMAATLEAEAGAMAKAAKLKAEEMERVRLAEEAATISAPTQWPAPYRLSCLKAPLPPTAPTPSPPTPSHPWI